MGSRKYDVSRRRRYSTHRHDERTRAARFARSAGPDPDAQLPRDSQTFQRVARILERHVADVIAACNPEGATDA